jgi:hypothetical protein
VISCVFVLRWLQPRKQPDYGRGGGEDRGGAAEDEAGQVDVSAVTAASLLVFLCARATVWRVFDCVISRVFVLRGGSLDGNQITDVGAVKIADACRIHVTKLTELG